MEIASRLCSVGFTIRNRGTNIVSRESRSNGGNAWQIGAIGRCRLTSPVPARHV